MEAISGRKTIEEIAANHAIHPIQVSQWKRQLLDGASELFTRGKQTRDKEEGQAKEAELFQQIGRLQMELEWLKKSLSCFDARELRKLVDSGHSKLSISRQCALLGPAQVHAVLQAQTGAGIDAADHGPDRYLLSGRPMQR